MKLWEPDSLGLNMGISTLTSGYMSYAMHIESHLIFQIKIMKHQLLRYLSSNMGWIWMKSSSNHKDDNILDGACNNG